jgi:Pectate lyase superfamily protein/Carbohydrate binding module (family 6)
MRICLFLFLLFTQIPTYATTVLSQGTRNVKNGAPYGGASAVGDGVHDDTQAFLDAFNLHRGMGGPGTEATDVAVYVPPGTYLVTKFLIPWGPIMLFGEPSSPPTITLKANSITVAPPDGNGTNLPPSFIIMRWGTNHNPYDRNWNTNDGAKFRSNNNCFFVYLHDINFTVQSGNTACSSVLAWSPAQCTAFRNSVLTGTASQAAALDTEPGLNGEAGGGGVIHNITCNGCQNATIQNSVFERVFRGCTFNGPVLVNGGINAMSFIACTFNNPGGAGLSMQTNPLLTLDDCVFTSGTPLTNSGNANTHIENITFGAANANPFFPAGVTAEWTSSSVTYNGVSESGTSSNLNTTGVVRGSQFFNPAYLTPGSSCVNVQTYGAIPDGRDCTTPIRNALLASKEVYFPPGTYVTTQTITLSAGQHLFGQGLDLSKITGGSSPVISVTGRGNSGVGLIAMGIVASGSNPCINWNGDQTSVLMDTEVGCSTSGVPGPLINFQSGGAFLEDSCPALLMSANAVGQCYAISSTDPLYLVAVDPQHFNTTPITMSNAQNVSIREMTYEMLISSAMTNAMTITGGKNIDIGALCLADRSGGTAATYGVNISGSSVSLWETSMNSYGTAIIHDGTRNTGTGGTGGFQVVNGYVDFTGSTLTIPSVSVSAATVGSTTATLHGSITSNGSQTITSDGFDWGTTTAYGNSAPAVTAQSGSLTANLTGLTSGLTYHCRAKAVNSSGTGFSGDNTFTATSTSTPPPNSGPYKGIAAPLPGIVYASNYDLGGQGVGYQDSQDGNPGAYRTDGVDLKLTSDTASAGTGYVLGWRTAGEWNRYTVNAQAGKYTVSARVQSAFNTGKFHVTIDGSTVIAPVSVPLTGPWDIASSWKTVNLGTVTLTAGSHVVTVLVDAAWFDLNYLSFVAVLSTPTPVKYIQSAYATPQTQQQTVPVSYLAAQTAGNLNVVIVGWNDTASVVSSVKDSKGNVYQLAVGPTLLAGYLSQSIYYCPNILAATAGANAVTVAFNRPANYADIRILEYSGISQATPVDGFAAAVGNSTTSSSGVLATTSATDLLIGANMVLTGTLGAGTGFAQRLLTSDGDIVEDSVVTSVGSYSASAALSPPSAGWDMQIVAFRAASQ